MNEKTRKELFQLIFMPHLLLLGCFTSDRPREWVRWLPWAEFLYNTTYHSATKERPFSVVYGRPRPHITSSSYTHESKKVHQVDCDLRYVFCNFERIICMELWPRQEADKYRSKRENLMWDMEE